jgi:isoleucyl-tRNA synthetase
MDSFEIDKAMAKIMDFTINDLSRTYIRMTRDRKDTKKILGEALEKVSLMLAPFAPYVSESIYQLFQKGESVHLSKWPISDDKKIDKKIEEEFRAALFIIEKGFKERDRNQIGLKWPLSKATFYYYKELSKEIKKIISSQLNVKSLEFVKASENDWKVELTLKLTPELEAEGYAREVSRLVQSARKKIGLNKTALVEINILVDEEFKKVLDSQTEFLKTRTNAKEFTITTENSNKFEKNIEFKIKGKEGQIQINTPN